MKKILSIVIGIILVATVFAACSKEVNTDSTATTDKSTTVQSDSSTEINTITTTESTTQSTSQATYKKNVIMSFNAVQGAVISTKVTIQTVISKAVSFIKSAKRAVM